MSKVITDKEILKILTGAIKGDDIDDGDQYLAFLEGIGNLIADHFGGKCLGVTAPDSSGLGYCVHFQWDECVPEGGGIYERYDTDKPIKEWMEEEP